MLLKMTEPSKLEMVSPQDKRENILPISLSSTDLLIMDLVPEIISERGDPKIAAKYTSAVELLNARTRSLAHLKIKPISTKLKSDDFKHFVRKGSMISNTIPMLA